MKNKKKTLNNDGSLRKSGSGRKRGSNSFVKITYGQLKNYIGERTPILVSRVWLERLGFTIDQKESTITIKSDPLKEKQEIAFSFNNFNEE